MSKRMCKLYLELPAKAKLDSLLENHSSLEQTK
jgi:hypothetical protein